MIRWGKGREQEWSGSEKVGHLLFHEVAKALRVVSVGVPPWGRAQPCLNTHLCSPSSRSCSELTLRLLPNPGLSDTHRPSWGPGMESSSLSVRSGSRRALLCPRLAGCAGYRFTSGLTSPYLFTKASAQKATRRCPCPSQSPPSTQVATWLPGAVRTAA